MMPAAAQDADDERLRQLLQLVADHPWADTGFFCVCGGWSRYQLEHTAKRAVARGLMEQTPIPSSHRRPPLRLGLTPAGAGLAGRPFVAERWRRTLLAALRLDPARLVLARLHEAHSVMWSFSPYTVPLKAILPAVTNPGRKKRFPKSNERLISIPLEALACVQVQAGDAPRYANVAILVEPGGIALDWFAGVFRRALAWRNRPEFEPGTGLAPEHAFPVFIVVAANADRQTGLRVLWRKSISASYSTDYRPGPFLRTLTRKELVEFDRDLVPLGSWRWRTENGQTAALWNGVKLARQPSVRPLGADAAWWGNRAVSVAESSRIVGLRYAKKKHSASRRGVVAGSRRQPAADQNPGAASATQTEKDVTRDLVKDHLGVSAAGRWLLDRVGLYPLIKGNELALVLGQDAHNVSRELRSLRARGLIARPPDTHGSGLAWRGLALLAYQAGFEPEEYARLRRWPLIVDEQGQCRLSLEAWLAQREHTEITLAFLAGLRRCGPAARLTLAEWDHTPWPETFPAEDGRSQRLTPDARGLVRVCGDTPAHCVETPFWLEVDCGTLAGRRLMDKLARYYAVGGPGAGVRGRAERLLIVVPQGDEARLQGLRRRLRRLDEYYGTQLDVRLARLDQLDAGQGRLDPTRRVWRGIRDSTFMNAFNKGELS